MPEGKITFSKTSDRNGQITGDNGTIYHFSFDDIITKPLPQFLRDRRVRFTLDSERPVQIELLETGQRSVTAPSAQPTASSATQTSTTTAPSGDPTATSLIQAPTTPVGQQPGGRTKYRFLNPYNFVRVLEQPRPSDHVLGDVPPPPHDRYLGLSGTITCRLEATTPIFVSDSHDVTRDPQQKDHFHYRFYRDPDGNVTIPGTSLRGPLRSVFEAATNSCLFHFVADKRLSYRPPPGEALKLVPGRVIEQNGRWELELLTGKTLFVPGSRPSGPQYAAWVAQYTPMRFSQTVAKVPRHPYSTRSTMTLGSLKHKDPCQAIIEKVKHPLKSFEFWNVVEIAPDGAAIRKADRAKGEELVDGYLCITNQNIDNKHDERLFFRQNGTRTLHLELSATVRTRYGELIKDYQERHADTLDKRKPAMPEVPHGRDPAFSRFIVHKRDANLADGDLVYAMIDQRGRALEVRYIVPVSVPRVTYDHTVGELLVGSEDDQATHFCACDNYQHLCPACRVFGWVWQGAEEEDVEKQKKLDEPTAYAGRVRISQAQIVTSAGILDNVTLAILSTPKPTTTRFYLAPRSSKPLDNREDDEVNYDAPGQRLRGRKFYRHHGAKFNEREYQSAVGKNNQNRTVHGVQKAGSTFSFSVRFENLAPIELGALLWTLEIDGWHHRIGFGKPLGFGSATIAVTELQILKPNQRYRSLDMADLVNALDQKAGWIDEFKQAISQIYKKPFAQLPNIRDLKGLLADTPPHPVHYPRSTREPHPQGRNYEWFVGNKRSGRDAGPRFTLRLADEDTEGLPLLDRFGAELE